MRIRSYGDQDQLAESSEKFLLTDLWLSCWMLFGHVTFWSLKKKKKDFLLNACWPEDFLKQKKKTRN